MRRRKFVIGAGALFAGTAAATGTGAFTTMSSGARTTEVKVAGDSEAYVELKADSEYAKSTEDDKLKLYFNDEQAVFEGGINPGSTYNFEDVFTVAADHEFGDTYFYIETSGFDVDVEFSASEEDDSGNSFPNTPGQTLTDPDNPYKLFQPDDVMVDMTIEGTESSNAEAGGTITIHAASGGNQDELGGS
jgi:hypothetical protein